MSDSPWSNQVVSQIIISALTGAQEGLFMYQGTPGPGNLVLALSPQAGTDIYGNAYSAVIDVVSAVTINNNGVFCYA